MLNTFLCFRLLPRRTLYSRLFAIIVNLLYRHYDGNRKFCFNYPSWNSLIIQFQWILKSQVRSGFDFSYLVTHTGIFLCRNTQTFRSWNASYFLIDTYKCSILFQVLCFTLGISDMIDTNLYYSTHIGLDFCWSV